MKTYQGREKLMVVLLHEHEVKVMKLELSKNYLLIILIFKLSQAVENVR